MEPLTELNQIIFNLTEENIEESAQQTVKLFDSNLPYSFNFVISNFVYSAFFAQKNTSDMYLSYLELIRIKEEEINKNMANIIKIFTKYITQITSNETNYLIEKMNERSLIDEDVINHISTHYFDHRKSKKSKESYHTNSLSEYYFNENYDELSKNDWELHKHYIKEGHNPNEIAKTIRNDEIEKLQEISSQNNFNFNQFIESSLYERCSFINTENVILIDYAAFFSSVKCFKFLLMNNAIVKNTGKYAVAGGNEEIIHLCEQNHSSFFGSCEAAIKFHRNDIFKYIYENKLESDLNERKIEEFMCLCVEYGNYKILSFLEEKGYEIKDSIINESAKNGNIYLVKKFLQSNKPPNDILMSSSESGNYELLKYILEIKGIDINAKDIYLLNLKFILIILYFKIIFGNYLNYLKQHLY